MGLDAIMYFRLGKPREIDTKLLSYKLASFSRIVWHEGPDSPCIYAGRESEIHQVLENFYTVNLTCRFWSPDYARGPFLEICSVAEFIESELPDAEVMYGDDCSENYYGFGRAFREEWKKLFFDSAYSTYRSAFNDRAAQVPICSFDNQPMYSHAWSGDKSLWACNACKEYALTNADTIILQSRPEPYKNKPTFEEILSMAKV